MLRLLPFKYYAPQTIAETLKILGDYGPEAMLVAGGTDVYPKMKRRQFQPKALVGLRELDELLGVTGDQRRGLTIGAGTTLTQIANHPEIRAHYPGLATAAGVVSTPALRNMGTIGGNLCLDTRCNYYDQTYEWRKSIHWCKKAPGAGLTPEQVPCRVAPGSSRCWAVSSTDTAPMLMALGAEITLINATGERKIPISALYVDDGMDYMTKQPGELLTTIHLPPANGTRSAYMKLRRRGAFDFPVLGAAVTLSLDDDQVVRDARIVLGGIASLPVHMKEAAALMVGQPYGEVIVEAAGQAAFTPVRPMDNTDYQLLYRKKMVPVYIAKAFREAVK